MRRLMTALIVLLLLFLSGCSKPDTPAPGTETATPKVFRRTVYRGWPGIDSGLEGRNIIDVAADTPVVVGGGNVEVSLWSAASDLAGRVRVAGHTYDQVNPGDGFVWIRFPPGPERWEVWLDGVADSRVVLERKAEPTVQVAYRQGNNLVPVMGNELRLAGPVALEFRFDQPMASESLTRFVDAAGGGGKASWVSPDQAVWLLDVAPARLEMNLAEFQATTGLLVMPRHLLLQSAGGAPYLERINLAIGTRERLTDLPAEIIDGRLSPDGRWLVVRTWEQRQNFTWWGNRLVLADLQRKQVQEAPVASDEYHWRSDNSLVTFGRGYAVDEPGWFAWRPGAMPVEHPERIRGAAVSPEGGFAAFLQRADLTDETKPVPSALVIVDLKNGASERVEGFVNGWYVGKGGDWSQWVAFSPDGQRVAALDPVERDGTTALVLYDRKTAQRRVVRQQVAMPAWGTRLFWSPDGGQLLATGVGRGAIIPLAGGPVVNLPEGGRNDAFWNADGKRVLAARGDWKGVYVFTAATGQLLDLGDGLPVGWAGEDVYLVRWAASDTRYAAGGP